MDLVMRRARSRTGMAPAMTSADTMMTAYSAAGVCWLLGDLLNPRPRSISATTAATLTPTKTNQMAAQVPIRMRSVASGDTIGHPRRSVENLSAISSSSVVRWRRSSSAPFRRWW
jgi:TnpA family transposase